MNKRRCCKKDSKKETPPLRPSRHGSMPSHPYAFLNDWRVRWSSPVLVRAPIWISPVRLRRDTEQGASHTEESICEKLSETCQLGYRVDMRRLHPHDYVRRVSVRH